MAGKIPQSFIDDLLARVNIIDILDGRVDKLKRTGKNYSGLCPFHQEKTPSFTANQEKQFYYCFGCGAGGNALGFMMAYDRLEFPQAVEYLARHAGMEVPREESPEAEAHRKAKQKSLSILDEAKQFYCQQLRESKERDQAVNYLKSRGLTGQIAKVYEIGFAPSGWSNLLDELVEKKSFSKKEAELSGLAIHNEEKDRYYDRFRHRIMFPIKDTRGRVIGFGGRVLGDEKPKYLNSPETNTFHKGKELYGLYEARQLNSRLERYLIVEGYMDVIGLAQYGITYAVATLGTAATKDHLEKLFKTVNEIVFCFDGDAAGRQAAERALNIALPAIQDGQSIKFLFLPDGEDPDSLVRKEGQAAFEERLSQQAKSLADFFIERQKQDLNLNSIDGRARFAANTKPYIDSIQAPILRQLFSDEISNITGYQFDSAPVAAPLPVPENEASFEPSPPIDDMPPPDYGDYEPSDMPNFADYPDSTSAVSSSRSRATQRSSAKMIGRLVSLLIQHPSLARTTQLPNALSECAETDYALLSEMFHYLNAHPNHSLSTMLIDWQESEQHRHLAEQLSVIQSSELSHSFESAQKILQDGIARLESERRSERIEQLKKQNPLSPEDRAELMQLLLNK
ncbi:MAG: DNA primase [Pontibacterium sp.]